MKMINLRGIQEEQKQWSKRNFPDSTHIEPLMGMVEEIGELFHAELKRRQGIRGTEEEHIEAAKDAVGDVVIYMMDYCTKRGWDLEEIIAETWLQVQTRDWVNNPKSGAGEQKELDFSYEAATD